MAAKYSKEMNKKLKQRLLGPSISTPSINQIDPFDLSSPDVSDESDLSIVSDLDENHENNSLNIKSEDFEDSEDSEPTDPQSTVSFYSYLQSIRSWYKSLNYNQRGNIIAMCLIILFGICFIVSVK